MKRRMWSVVATLVAVALVLAACAPAPTPQVIEKQVVVEKPVYETIVVEKVVEKPVKETVVVEKVVEKVITATPEPQKLTGDLDLYSCTLSGDQWDELVAIVKDEIGVDLYCLDMGSGEMVSRAEAEAGNPAADLGFGNDSSVYELLKEEELLEPYKGPGWELVPDGFKDPDGYWVGLYLGVISFAYTDERLQELGVEPPDSWEDLLDPKLKGEVVIASPAASGTAYTVLSSLVALMGEDEAFEYWKKLDQNIAYYSKSGSEPGKKAASGEFAVGVCFAHDNLRRVDEGFPLKISFPADGTGWEIGGMGIFKGARHMEAAKLFMDLVLSPEVQLLQAAGTEHRLPVVEGVPVPPGTPKLEDVNPIAMDKVWAGTERERLIARWEDEIGSLR